MALFLICRLHRPNALSRLPISRDAGKGTIDVPFINETLVIQLFIYVFICVQYRLQFQYNHFEYIYGCRQHETFEI